ncbi:L-2,4-diaminobutyrate decarboxylase [Pantoea agglomerans]|uniref:L-2,4-diaminobutyrate decarboxylase n=1 Tax=Enterobacter agglomerans TaxID=549 RepID=A0A379LTK1_ENTAG|nr:L-2,4-diaminobutyrate decarboxylase [Pantoea agglomerans]
MDGSGSTGQKQYAEIIDHGVTLAQQVAQYVDEQPALELVMKPQLASVLFRYRPAHLAHFSSADIALLNQRIGDALLESGRANVGVTEFDGVTCLKMTLLNPTVTLGRYQSVADIGGNHGTAAGVNSGVRVTIRGASGRLFFFCVYPFHSSVRPQRLSAGLPDTSASAPFV